ncbi:MAG: hypothetical protein KF774_15550 [Planctomyces sp.]|nr:hypothetical protein [Planctomyces sp.]
MFQKVLAKCAKNVGESPRRISLWDRLTYWRVARPPWLKSGNELETVFQNLASLRRDGVVLWGHIVQANELMFSPGPYNCPGDVVYSLDAGQRADPIELGEVAHALFSLKHTKPADRDLAAIADDLTSECTPNFGKRIPSAISPVLSCRMSSIYFVRKHLPGPAHCLTRPVLPIIVLPTPPHVAMVLPSRYWPRMLVEWWQGEELAAAPARRRR